MTLPPITFSAASRVAVPFLVRPWQPRSGGLAGRPGQRQGDNLSGE